MLRPALCCVLVTLQLGCAYYKDDRREIGLGSSQPLSRPLNSVSIVSENHEEVAALKENVRALTTLVKEHEKKLDELRTAPFLLPPANTSTYSSLTALATRPDVSLADALQAAVKALEHEYGLEWDHAHRIMCKVCSEWAWKQEFRTEIGSPLPSDKPRCWHWEHSITLAKNVKLLANVWLDESDRILYRSFQYQP